MFKTIHLKEIYTQLNTSGDPTLEVLVQDEPCEQFIGRDNISPRPAVFILPGGAYAKTWIGEGNPVAYGFMADGCNCFVLHYSVAPNTYPEQILEVALALDYIYSNAKEFNVDTEKIAIMGFSAGGHLAASYCTIRDTALEGILQNPKPVSAAILCYPVISAGEYTHIGSITNLVGKTEISKKIRDLLSLEKQVNSITPPTFIWTTAEDNAVNPKNTLMYASALQDAGISYELHIFPKGGHGMSTAKLGVVNSPTHHDIKHMSVWQDLARNWLRNLFDF